MICALISKEQEGRLCASAAQAAQQELNQQKDASPQMHWCTWMLFFCFQNLHEI